MNYVFDEAKGFISAIVPEYTHDVLTRVYYKSGLVEGTSSRVVYILEKYLSFWYNHLTVVGSFTNKTNTAGTKPFAVTLNHTFIPIRIRDRQARGDTSYGFFCHEDISYLNCNQPRKFATLICNNTKFNTLTTNSTLHIKKELAIEAQLTWKKRNGYLTREVILQKDFCNWLISGMPILDGLIELRNADKGYDLYTRKETSENDE